MLWGDSAACSSARESVQDLSRATPGSEGLDLSSNIYVVLTLETGVQALSTDVYGPLPKGTIGLLLERSKKFLHPNKTLR